jgi:hypothetical protein
LGHVYLDPLGIQQGEALSGKKEMNWVNTETHEERIECKQQLFHEGWENEHQLVILQGEKRHVYE